MLSFARRRLKGAGGAVAFAALTAAIASLFGIINPAFFRIFLDQLLTGENPEWLVPFLSALVSMAAETAVLILGVWLAMEGRFTTGMLLAFQGFLGAFTAPASQLIGAGQTLQEMRPQMERVEDVMDYPSDTEAAPQEAETSGKLSGALGGTYTQLILNE